MSRKVVIVGAGHAAGQCVATLLQKKFAGSITLLGEERWYPYQRPPLSKKFLAGELDAERLHFKPQNFYDDVDVRLSTRVAAILPDERAVRTDSGEEFCYDDLVIATGSRARELPIEGSDLAGVHYLRGIDDVNAIRAEFRKDARLAIIGAGYIGLEVAAVAKELGLDVTVLEAADRVMSRVVSPQVSGYFQSVHEAHGVNLHLSAGASALQGDKSVARVLLESGAEVATDLVIIGVGIVPNVELAEAAGLRVDNGIVVDDRCRTSAEDVYAIGDCTSHPNTILDRMLRLESVHNALEQAKTAAANICGENSSYEQVPWFWSDQYDLKLQIAGISEGYDQTVVRGDMNSASFACLYLAAGRLIAIDAINRPRDFMQAKALIADQAVIDTELLADADVMLKDMAN